ncbi:MAG: hypothetical protein ACLQG3_09560 [Terracidiphilus sp.]
MIQSSEEIRSAFGNSVTATLKDFGFRPEIASALGDSLKREAVEIVPWSTQSLATVTKAWGESGKFLQIDQSANPPVVVYYRPRKAAQIAISALFGVAGAAAVNFPVVALAVISCLLGVSEFRTVPSPAECLLFSIVYNEGSNAIERSDAQRRFSEEATEPRGITPGDFDPALFNLLQIALLKQTGVWLEIADKVIVHR